MTHGLNRATAVRVLQALLALVFCAALAPAGESAERPNIVLIVADYMGYADIGPYGAVDISTPTLDALAEQGTRFSAYYSANPVCGPSRAALLSGFYPAKAGMESNVTASLGGGLASSRDTLMRQLVAAGYRTAMIGKWHLGNEADTSPLAHGFDHFFGFHTWTLGYHTHRTAEGEPGLYRNDNLVREGGYLTDLLSREAVAFIAGEHEQPFFVYLAYNTALPPYQGPNLPRAKWDAGWDVNKASRDEYRQMVEAMDRSIGRVLEQLDDDTLVLFTYDHGGRNLSDSSPLFHGFATLWEGGIRVPLIVRWPGRVTAGRTIDQPAIAMDLTATMIAAAGRDLAELALDGDSLLPTLRGERTIPARKLFWRVSPAPRSMRAVRHGRWKYVVDYGSQFLFDLEADIGERKNLLAARPEIAGELREALATWEAALPD